VTIDGYADDQLSNAQAIITAARDLHLGTDAQVLGVAAAIGESSLHNIPYGDDATNPDGTTADSVGLFQQQHWWGSTDSRMNPRIAASVFFTHLEAIPGWRAMTPTAAIHAVQGNADPDYYTPDYPPALAIVSYLDRSPLHAAVSSPDTTFGQLDFGAVSDIVASNVASSLAPLGGAFGN
jgi:hypothetical protein